MKRRAHKFMTLVSMLLCLAIAALWVRSYWVGDILWYMSAPTTAEPKRISVSSEDGRLDVEVWSFTASYYALFLGELDVPRSGKGWESYGSAAFVSIRRDAQMFSYRVEDSADPHDPTSHLRQRSLRLPHWLLVPLLLVAPFLWLRRARRDRRWRQEGRCNRCGYDLRATPDRCPECGSTPRGVSKADKLS